MSIKSRIDQYKKFTDVSDLTALFERCLKTQDLNMEVFLLKRIQAKLNNISRQFPLADFSDEIPEFREFSEGIKIGSVVIEGTPVVDFSLSKSDLNKNILIAASVGHGKTSLIYNILSKLKAKEITYILFDLKRDYASLAFDENTVYFDSMSLKLNPLIPPKGVSWKEWAVHFADAFSHSFSLLIGSRDFLLASLLKFYKSLEEKITPTLPDFLRYLDGSQIRNEYFRVVRGRIEALLSSTEIFDCSEGVSLYDLDSSNLILGIDRLGIHEQGFLFSLVLSYLFYLNINDQAKRNKFYKIVAVDDAHVILDSNKDKDYALGIPLLHQIIAKMRELGVGFLFSDQQLSSLISSAIQNSNIKFIGRINLAEDINRVFGFSDKSVLAKINNLMPGEFLVLSPKVSPYCVVKVDVVKVDKNADETLLELTKRRHAERFKSNTKNQYAREIFAILSEISTKPSFNISLHAKNLSAVFDYSKFDELRKKMLTEGLLEEIDFALSEGKSSTFLYIPKSAKNILMQKYDGDAVGFLLTYTRDAFTKKVLKDLTIQKLKKAGINFEDDGVGLLITGLRKIYITFMEAGDVLARLAETAFDLIIDVVDDTIKETDVIPKIMKASKSDAFLNLKAIKISRIKDFNLN